MNTTASYSSEPSWSRRCSTETIFSIQGKETDFVRDTSDTEWCSDDGPVEYEPVTEPEDEGEGPVSAADTSGQSDNEIISTKVIAVSVRDDGDLEFADSEQTESEGSDSEMDLYDYWHCAQCRAENNNPLYRYCEKCFKVRKSFFPPRPKRKHKLKMKIEPEMTRTLSQDSGVESTNSQELSQIDTGEGTSAQNDSREHTQCANALTDNVILPRPNLKRRAESADRASKRTKVDTDSEIESDKEVKPLVKMVSDPALTVDNSIDPIKLTKKAIVNSLKEKLDAKDDMCIVCLAEPKSGVFVHGRIAHICCCYKCAVKVWAKAKRCPVCNCKVSNVLRAVVM